MGVQRAEHRRCVVCTRRFRWFIVALVLVVALAKTSLTFAARSVAEIAEDEIRHIESHGFIVPKRTIATFDFTRFRAFTVISTQSVRYTIVLKPWYWREDQTRYVVGHEVGHVIFDVYGVAQDEALVDRFAACFGSEGANHWATTVESIDPGDCKALKAEVNDGNVSIPD